MSLTIKKKLIGFSLFYLAVLIVLLTTVAFFWQKANVSLLIKEKVRITVTTISNGRISEKAYLQYYSQNYVTEVENILTKIDQQLKQLAKDLHNDNHVSTLISDIMGYKSTFRALVAQHRDSASIQNSMDHSVGQGMNIIGGIFMEFRAKESELVAEGLTLDAEAKSVLDAATDIKMLLFELRGLFYEFLKKGDISFLNQFNHVIRRSAEGNKQAIIGFASRLKDEALDTKVIQLAKIIDTCGALATPTLSSYESENELVKQIDQIGTTTVADADSLLNKVQKDADKAQLSAKIYILIISVVGAALALFFGLSLSISITGAIKNLINVIKDIAQGEGDLTKRLNASADDELGELSKWFNTFLDKLQSLIKRIAGSTQALTLASQQMGEISQNLDANTQAMSAQSSNVAQSSEKLVGNMKIMSSSAENVSASLHNIAATSEELASTAQNVASSVEEMSSSIAEVSKNCLRELDIAKEASEKAQNARAVMDQLGTAAREIGNVVNIISKIAGQTNLLALNATIEAASAGEAGKGFAVVANEVKELARQSAQATERISQQIQNIQKNTSVSVDSMTSISKIIEDISQISQTIATSVEQQAATTKEIAGSMSGVSEATNSMTQTVQSAASNTNDLAGNVQSSAKETEAISENISGLNQTVVKTADNSTETNKSASELLKLASQLKEVVNQFKI